MLPPWNSRACPGGGVRAAKRCRAEVHLGELDGCDREDTGSSGANGSRPGRRATVVDRASVEDDWPSSASVSPWTGTWRRRDGVSPPHSARSRADPLAAAARTALATRRPKGTPFFARADEIP